MYPATRAANAAVQVMRVVRRPVQHTRLVTFSVIATGALLSGLVPGHPVSSVLAGQSAPCFTDGEQRALYSWRGYFVFTDKEGRKSTRTASGSVWATSKEEARGFVDQELAQYANETASLWRGEVVQMGMTSLYKY
jgi:hypothetical protein